MKSTDFRTKKWLKGKDEALYKIGNVIDEWIEELVSDAVDDYKDSDNFCKDACQYCRDMGWKEPE